MNVVGAQRFWEWLQDRILKTFESRDYNRAITVPRYVATPTIEEFQKRIKGVIESTTAQRREEIIEGLRNVKELIETEDKVEEIKNDLLENYVLRDMTVQKIDSKLQELIDQLPPVEENTEDESKSESEPRVWHRLWRSDEFIVMSILVRRWTAEGQTMFT